MNASKLVIGVVLAAALAACIAIFYVVYQSGGESRGPWDQAPSEDAPETPQPAEPAFTVEDYPRVDGSESAHPLSVLVACQLTATPYTWGSEPKTAAKRLFPIVDPKGGSAEDNLHRDLVAKTTHSGTHQAYEKLIGGEADLILVTRRPRPDEEKLAQEKGAVLEIRPLATDALIFIVQGDNAATGMTQTQLRDIYAGTLKTWEPFGGQSGIYVCLRPENSCCRDAVDELVMRGAETAPARKMAVATMTDSVKMVQAETDAFGYTFRSYRRYVAPKYNVRPVAINGVSPAADETIALGKYPYLVELYAVVRRGAGGPAAKLRDWLLSPVGKAALEQAGYVPIR